MEQIIQNDMMGERELVVSSRGDLISSGANHAARVIYAWMHDKRGSARSDSVMRDGERMPQRKRITKV